MNTKINTEARFCKSNGYLTQNEQFENELNLRTGDLPKAQVPINDPKWHAIYTKSRFEKKIYRALAQSEFEAFLPLIKEKRVWSDRLKTVEVPLLPSYVFVKVPKNCIHQLYYYPGFVRYVSFGGKPCVVRQEEIELLEQIVRHGFQAQQSVICNVGDAVRVIRGPLKGWEGRVELKKGGTRIVFQFNSIQQAISVEVEVSDVERV
ncbi:MAG: UpxY family transcription antiterminator [Lewinellaceae bacterium]|nr:UpxY family transcription antiterminator [Lewinellaceae bacterium]